ncbi:MAG: glycosyl transferase [Acidimicrobiia bacterium]
MTVVHVITGLGGGGAEAVLHRLIQQRQANDRHVVISLTTGGVYGPKLEALGARVVALGVARGRVSITALGRLKTLIADVAPDVVQTWMYHADLAGGIASRLAGCRAVVWGVHSSNLDPPATRGMTRWVAGVCARLSSIVPVSIVCCSEAASRVHAALGYCKDKLVVISNGVDLTEFRPNLEGRLAIRAELGMPNDVPLIGMVGRWDPLKDHLGFIRALSGLQDRMPGPWRVLLVGAGIDADNETLANAITTAGLADRVLCLGLRTDVPALMNAIDLHVLPSIGESFGNVTVEAMACGTPAIVTDVGAGEFIVGDTGWVVPAAAPSLLAETMFGALLGLTDVGAWQQRRAAARARAHDHFGVAQMQAAYRAVWQRAVVG